MRMGKKRAKHRPGKHLKHEHVSRRRKAYGFLLALPPAVALVMIAVIAATNKAIVIAPEGIMLSPVRDISPLIMSLCIFIAGYLAFIGMLFKDNVKRFFSSALLHKNLHKK